MSSCDIDNADVTRESRTEERERACNLVSWNVSKKRGCILTVTNKPNHYLHMAIHYNGDDGGIGNTHEHLK